jgi:hypothetical protein
MAGASVGWLGGLTLCTLVLGAGCARAPADADGRLAALEEEGRQMDEVLDGVESRLLASQANVHLWQEMSQRHRHVSALHCKSAGGHLDALAQHLERQEERARGLQRRRQVASVDGTALGGPKEGARVSN